jgi:hypothetical protein
MRKDPTTIIIIILAFAVFGFISFLLIFKPNRWLIAYKLKLGGIILSLTFMVSCGSPQPTCYDVAISEDSVPAKDSLVVNTDTLSKTDSLVQNIGVRKKKKNTVNQKVSDTIIQVGPPERPTCYALINHSD